MKSRRKKEIKHDNGCYQNDRIFVQKQRPGKGGVEGREAAYEQPEVEPQLTHL